MTNFEYALGRQFSEALDVAQIAMDPDLRYQRGEEYPPLLTSMDYANQFFVRSDDPPRMPDEEGKLAERLNVRLLKWASEGFFEVVPLPDVGRGDVGFRITSEGMVQALEAIRSKTTRMRLLGNRVNRLEISTQKV